MNGLIPNKTQCERILEILQEAKGRWVDGMYFLRMHPPVIQFHARLWELQRRGHQIEGRFIEGKSWKEYRLRNDNKTQELPVYKSQLQLLNK